MIMSQDNCKCNILISSHYLITLTIRLKWYFSWNWFIYEKNHYFVIPDSNFYILMYVLYNIMVLIAFFISLGCDCDKPNIWCWIPSDITVQSGSQHIAPSCQAVLAASGWPFRLCEWWGRRADGNLDRPGEGIPMDRARYYNHIPW